MLENAAPMPNPNVIALGMFKLDLEPLAPKVLKNRDAHIDYIKHSREHADILREIVENARALSPIDSNLDSACTHVQRLQELADKSLGAIQRKIGSHSNKKKNKVEDHPRIAKSSLNKKNYVIEPMCNANVKHTTLNANFELIYVKCNQCMFDANHDVCCLEFVNDVNVLSKSKTVKRNKKNIWKPTRKVFTNIGYKWNPTRRTFIIVGNACPLTRITSTKVEPLKETSSKSVNTPNIYRRKTKVAKSVDLSSELSYPNCSLVFGLRMLQAYDQKPLLAHQLCSKTFGYCKIKKQSDCKDNGLWRLSDGKCYDFSGLLYGRVRPQLIFRCQFCDSDLEVTFHKHTYYIHDLEGVDLLKGSRGSNLYMLSLEDILLSSPICLLSKASKTKFWLWHRRLTRLNFEYITTLAKQGLVQGLSRLKFQKDHLCFACALGKSKKHSHKPTAEDRQLRQLVTLKSDP
ncbi:retrovirus-related pol polyprotein from transposon TNT 1-94 [Tanacetum coccineum]